MEITQEKAFEYQQVAALVCSDLDRLVEMIEQPGMTLERVISQVKYTKKLKDEAISDKEKRQRRYSAFSMLFSLNRP